MNEPRGRYGMDGIRPSRGRRGVWEIRISLGPDPIKRDKNGRPVYRQKSITFHGTRAAARLKRVELQHRHAPEYARTDATFGELFERWLTNSTDMEESTARSHRALASKHILPAFGERKLREIRGGDVEDFYASLHRPKTKGGAGLHPRSVRRIHAIINTAFKRAVVWEWLDRNPAANVRPPRVVGSPDTYTPTLVELQRALIAAAEVGPWALAFVWTAAATGMRRGELCGLQWADVDGIAQVVHVRRNIVDVAGEEIEKSPKTGRTRLVEIPAELVVVLDAYHQLVGDESPWLWSSGGRRVRAEKLTATWARVREAAEIPKACRLHDLRHAYGSILVEEGGEGVIVALAGQLGHADKATTLRHYLAASRSGQRALADRMGQLLAGTNGDEHG